jgi:alkylated DNA repair dioxygenase AlkB
MSSAPREGWFESGQGASPPIPLLERHELPDGSLFWSGALPDELLVEGEAFEALWSLHPETYHTIKMHGRPVKTPRFQQAYGADYRYTGNTNRALVTPPALAPYLEWGREFVDPRLNGLLLNWYEGTKNHYIGKHRDSTVGMFEGCPIVTISHGERRVFRLRPWKSTTEKIDFEAFDSAVFVLPYATNLRWTHEVPPSKRLQGRRISITLRGFRPSE